MSDRARGALVGAAVGDALGAPFEGRRGPVPVEEIDRAAAAPRLRTTDDTAMTLSVAASLQHRGGLDEDHLAATFAAAYTRDPDRGYGAGTAALLQQIAAGASWRDVAHRQFGGRGSYGNGAAMRAAPYGVVAAGAPERAADLARRAARVTHTHLLGMEGAGVQAAAVSLLLDAPAGRPAPPVGLVAALDGTVTDDRLRAALATAASLADGGTPAQVAERLGTGVSALEAVPAALWAFLRHPGSFPDAVHAAIGLGGDTDTIGSMTGALSGALLGSTAIPGDWVDRTEHTRELSDLADALKPGEAWA